MRYQLVRLVCVLVLAFLPQFALANDSVHLVEEFGFTSDLSPSDRKVVEGLGLESLDWSKSVVVNSSALDADRIEIDLYDRTVVVLSKKRKLTDPSVDRVWFGYVVIEGDHPDLKSSTRRAVVLTRTHHGQVFGNINIDNLRYEIRTLPSGANVLFRFDQSREPTPVDQGDVVPLAPEKRAKLDDRTSRAGEADTDIIRVVVGVTLDAESPSYTQFQQDVFARIQSANESFAESNVALQIQLVAYARPAYNETTIQAAYDELQLGDDGDLWLVQYAREQVYADVAIMVVQTALTEPCGQAPQSPAAEFARLVVRRACFGTHVITHELGHILDANHNVENVIDPSDFEYAHGYRYLRQSKLEYSYKSMMAQGDYVRENWWSSPLQTWFGRPRGTAELQDNARVVRQTKSSVATFYPDPPPGAIVPSLVPTFTNQGIESAGF